MELSQEQTTPTPDKDVGLDRARQLTGPVDVGTCSAYIDGLVASGIEAENQDQLADKIGQLLADYQLDGKYLLENPRESLLLAGIAAQELVSGINPNRRDALAVAILGRHETESERQFKGRQSETINIRFTNRELSAAIVELINGPLFADVRQYLGVTAEQIDDEVDVRVLNVSSNQAGSLLPKLLDLDPEGRELFDAHRAGLTRKGDAYKAQRGDLQGRAIPLAWTNIGVDGAKNTIYIPALVAEELIALTNLDGAESDNPNLARWLATEVATAKHELVHCLDGLFLSDGFYGVGLLLDERRAEHFSGDRQGYLDIKWGLQFVFGTREADVDWLFPKDGTYDSDKVFTELASRFGLETMLDLATAVPGPYEPAFANGDQFSARYLTAGNSFNEALLRILRREADKYGPGHAEGLIEHYVDEWVSRLTQDGTELSAVEDNLAMSGPAVLSVLGIRDFRERYPRFATTYDYQKVYGHELWSIEI